MNRIILGAVGALLLVGAGIFWWQGRAQTERGAALPEALPAISSDETLPTADGAGLMGEPPPTLDPVTREQRRFDRLDRNRDNKIVRAEMLGPRVPAFRKLDVDGNNLLSFEEWAVKTSEKFHGADRDGDQALNRLEFATIRPKPAEPKHCRCSPIRPGRKAAAPESDGPSSDESGEGGEPAE